MYNPTASARHTGAAVACSSRSRCDGTTGRCGSCGGGSTTSCKRMTRQRISETVSILTSVHGCLNDMSTDERMHGSNATWRNARMPYGKKLECLNVSWYSCQVSRFRCADRLKQQVVHYRLQQRLRQLRHRSHLQPWPRQQRPRNHLQEN